MLVRKPVGTFLSIILEVYRRGAVSLEGCAYVRMESSGMETIGSNLRR